MANSSIAAFAAIMALVAFVSLALFVLRAEKVRKTGMRKRDIPMIGFLALTFVSLFAFSASMMEITDVGIAMTVSGGLAGLFVLVAIYEIYLVLTSLPTKGFAGRAGRAWEALVFVGISLMVIGILAFEIYGPPNTPALWIGGIGMLIACYSFFSWLNTRESRRTDKAQ
jgi:hypothetical protein